LILCVLISWFILRIFGGAYREFVGCFLFYFCWNVIKAVIGVDVSGRLVFIGAL